MEGRNFVVADAVGLDLRGPRRIGVRDDHAGVGDGRAGRVVDGADEASIVILREGVEREKCHEEGNRDTDPTGDSNAVGEFATFIPNIHWVSFDLHVGS